jgi:hypothetical protein
MINLWNLNSICHLHLHGFIINFVLLLLWFGIYLYIVIANKILINLLKEMLSFNPYCWSALHITWTPTFGEFMPHYSPQLVERWTCVSSPLLSHTPHMRSTCGWREATTRSSLRSRWRLPVDFLAPRMDFRSFYIYLLFCKTSTM